ncbi:MAG TPA: 2-succinyl-5-enolpyruvyl-6-hydroxy-3-cyclohexene-1-carboxylic-acid synthase [Actinobacteria bacterium]|nr:2-succinyl-5-enolpyruvyl-6-hydroxy-3-cyclohexene-1-carboxylic-acid synthase [Actinomycetota bacterium]
MNPATAFASTVVDELVRCGLAEAVIAPGSRSAPLAMALWQRAAGGPALRLHVRIDERSAGFLALGLAKASQRPVAVVCTSGTAAAHLHAAVIEADEAGVPLLVLTADRPPELRGTGANQTIDQLKLYGGAVRWFCEIGVPEARPGMNAYWRSLACRAWAAASGQAGGSPGPVHLNAALREPLVPGTPDPAVPGQEWPEPLAGRPGTAPWTGYAAIAGAAPRQTGMALELPWTERGVVVCGDGCGDPAALAVLAEEAGWPLLAEPSSGARSGPNALAAYQYLLDSPEFAAAHRPDVIVSAGRPGLSRGQLAYLKSPSPAGSAPRHVVIDQGPGRWADPARTATDVAAAVCLVGMGRRPDPGWLASWRAADGAARAAAAAVLDADDAISEPRLARDLAAALPDGALLWAASSLPIRDLDRQMAPRAGIRVLASRGASGIDGLVSSAIGAALAHQRAGGGPAAALLGDLAFLHDAPGLFLAAAEPRPDLAIVVVNNDGGGIFSTLEQAAYREPFERVFGTPHGAALGSLAAAAGVPATVLAGPGDLPAALRGQGIRVVEVRTGRVGGAALRERIRAACTSAIAAHGRPG